MTDDLPRTRIQDDLMFTYMSGPLAVVRACRLCRHIVKIPKGLRGAGRGYGMREGNKARGEMIQHFKAVHMEAYAALKAEGRS